MLYVSEFGEDKLEAENRTRTWARIVPPCTILASGFVYTKPAYLKLFIRPGRRPEKLHVCDVLGVSLKLESKSAHECALFAGNKLSRSVNRSFTVQ